MDWSEWFRRRRRFPFDIDIFNWPFSPFYRDIDEMMKDMERRMEEVFREMSGKVPRGLVRERRMPDGSRVQEMGPFVYGYSVTVGPDGKPQIREFGNIKPSMRARGAEPPLDLSERREPLVDIMEQDSEVKVVAELPGVTKEDIRVSATETTLTISAETEGRRYHKELELPVEVDPASSKSRYNNGILEITLSKKGKKKGVEVKIE